MDELVAKTPEYPILLVDDERVITRILQDTLEHAGYFCMSASDAEEALHLLQVQPFSLMICDIRMPGMSGLDLLGQTCETYPEMPVIMLTGVDNLSTAMSAIRAGAFDYLSKPVNIDEVLFAVRRALEYRELRVQNREYQQGLEQKVQERTRLLRKLHQELESSFYGAIRMLIGLMELFEPFLGGHVRRVAALSITLARHLQLPEAQVRTIEVSALLHDIGLVGIPPRLMTKRRDMLSPQEFELIQQAPIFGQEALSSVKRLDEAGCIIRHLHERYDGSGFPDGLVGENIPYASRLLAITNAYDAMRFKRVPAASLPVHRVIQHLREQQGKQFDPTLVEAFFEMLRKQSQQQRQERSVTLDALRPGMKLSQAVQTEEGTLLLTEDTVLTEAIIAKLKRFHKFSPIIESQLYVYTD